MTSRRSLYRQIGGHHWKSGIQKHLQQTIPRERTFVYTIDSGWVYIIEDTPNQNNSLQLKTFHIDYQKYNLDFDNPDFEQRINNILDNPTYNILSVINVKTNT